MVQLNAIIVREITQRHKYRWHVTHLSFCWMLFDDDEGLQGQLSREVTVHYTLDALCSTDNTSVKIHP